MATAVEILRQYQDELTGAPAVVTKDHSYIHQGKAFTAVFSTGSISGAYNISFKTPRVSDGKYIHWRPIGITTSANYVQIKLTEGETYTGGTSVTPINRNRNSSNPYKMQEFKINTTCTPAGTLIFSQGAGSAGVPAAAKGGGAGDAEELVLKPDTVYNMALTPGGATVCELQLFWYEEEGYQ